MVMLKKALAILLASSVIALPALTEVAVAKTVPAQQQTQVVLPQGNELSETQLQEARGEFGPILTAVASGIVGGTLSAAATLGDQLYDRKGIKGSEIAVSFAKGFGLGVIGSPLIGVASKGLVIARSGLASAIRWTARAAAAAGPTVASVGLRVLSTFNRHIGGPIARFLGDK